MLEHLLMLLFGYEEEEDEDEETVLVLLCFGVCGLKHPFKRRRRQAAAEEWR